MKVTWRDIGPAGEDDRAVGGLDDVEAARRSKTLGEHSREHGRHVLNDEDGNRKIEGKRGEELAERIRAARRSADREDFERFVGHRAQLERANRNGLGRLRRAGADHAQGLEAADEDFRKAAVEAAGARLGERIGRAERKCRDGFLRAFLGKRRNDHDPCAAGRREDSRN